MPESKHLIQGVQITKPLKTFKRKIAVESWICSILCGLSIGFVAATICSFVLWAFGIKKLWISIAMFAATSGISAFLFYQGKFRRSMREIAYRADMLGLEERILTMTQFAEDNSFMARCQREDAAKALAKVDSSLLKITVGTPLVVMCVVGMLISTSVIAASAISDKSLIALINETHASELARCTVSYEVKDHNGGKIYGRCNQIVEADADDEMVQAVADDNYIFVGWSDGCEDALRTDKSVAKDIKVFAVFVPLEENDADDEEMPNNDGGEGNHGEDKSGLPQDGPTIPQPEENNPDNGESSGGATNPSNQVIDGGTFIGDVYSNSLSEAQDAMGNNAGLDGGQTDMIGDYFGKIAK